MNTKTHYRIERFTIRGRLYKIPPYKEVWISHTIVGWYYVVVNHRADTTSTFGPFALCREVLGAIVATELNEIATGTGPATGEYRYEFDLPAIARAAKRRQQRAMKLVNRLFNQT